MHIGADYYPEHWVFPYDGTEEAPESRWDTDAELMAKAGINVVRLGEFSWGLCEREEGKFDFAWLKRCMDVVHKAGIQVVLGTPTAAPPVWLLQKHPAILPLDENGLPRREGTRRAYCLNSDVYWEYSKKIVKAMVDALGKHEAVIAWQIDNGIGRHDTEYSFNPETRKDWHAWLKAKYETIENLNEKLGLCVWGQVVSDWEQVVMPMRAPAVHNPALVTDWRRFSSDTCVSYIRMQADLLHEATPDIPVTTTIRAFAAEIDLFDLADAIDFVSIDSQAAIGEQAAEIAFGIDLIRCLKKNDKIKAPAGEDGFWVMEQKAGSAAWEGVNSTVRPGVIRKFTHQLISRGANGVCFFYWRQPLVGPEKFYGGVLNHEGSGNNRMYKEICQIGEEIKKLAPILKGTHVVADTCILINFENNWAIDQPLAHNKFFKQKEHILAYYRALHDKNIPVDFARPPSDDEGLEELKKYRLVIAPSLHMLDPGQAQRLAWYVYEGGTLIGTCNTALIDEHHIAPKGYPQELIDMFGLTVKESDILPPGRENSLNFKGSFKTSKQHFGKLWCDIIEPGECQTLATFSREFYSGSPAVTINEYGSGKAIYIGTVGHQEFYSDVFAWLRAQLGLYSLIKVPDTVEVSMRQSEESRLYFVINHQNGPVRINFLKTTHDFLTGEKFSGNYDMPAHGVLMIDERNRF
jgi:beta-galactosidase